MARSLLCSAVVPPTTLIGIRNLWAGPSRALVLLTRNESGSIAGHCLLNGGERAVIDGQTAGLVLGVIEDVLEVLLLARHQSDWRAWRET
jgi:hypothetical protein